MEYGENGWKWDNQTLGPSGAKYDWDIYAHAVDQTNSSGIPYRYLSATSLSNNVCTGDSQTTNGKTAYSSINEQISCNPNTLNSGNWYNYPAATAGSDMHTGWTTAENSICPKGWRLSPNAGDKSYYNLIHGKYLITTIGSDSQILSSPLSFVRAGNYNYAYGSLGNRGSHGAYWSSTAYSDTSSHSLYFMSGALYPQNGNNRATGFSIRCVSR